MKKQRLLELAGVVTENNRSIQDELVNALYSSLHHLGSGAARDDRLEGDLESAFDMAAEEAEKVVRQILSDHGIS